MAARRNGKPVALIVGIEGLDAEQVELGSAPSFWKQIAERRQQPTLTREELERELEAPQALGPADGPVVSETLSRKARFEATSFSG